MVCSIPNQTLIIFKQIYLIHKVDLRVMAMKGYSTPPRTEGVKPQYLNAGKMEMVLAYFKIC